MKRLVPVLASLSLAACVTPGTSATPGLGQVGLVDGLRVRPLQVVEDSRCPASVRCVWPGRLVVRAEVIGGNWRQTYNLELGKPQQIADGSLTLIAAEPQKAVPGEIDAGAYRFTFDFQGGL